MILTFYYMYATFVQWWRLGTLRQKLSGTLNKQNALLLCSSTNCIGSADGNSKHQRSLENLLYQHDGRIACTIVPRQKLHLGQWATFPKDRKCFPIHYGRNIYTMRHKPSTKIYLLLQANLKSQCLESYSTDFIKMEQYGELIAWRATDVFEVILKSDIESITILLNGFRFRSMGVNHDLSLVKVETVDIEGVPSKLKYDRRRLRFSHGPEQFRQFASHLRELYSKITENINPKITIENGTTKTIDYERDRKPISEVKPIKKQISKHTLEVHAHKKAKNKPEKQSEAKKETDDLKEDLKEKVKSVKVDDLKDAKEKKPTKEQKSKSIKDDNKEKTDTAIKSDYYSKEKGKPKTIEIKMEHKEAAKSKEAKENELKEHTLPKSSASMRILETPKQTLNVTKKSYSDVTATPGKNLQRQNATSSKETSPNRSTKPPNILVYADTSLAKDNVKSVLKTIINKDKYTVYDFPTNINVQQFWNATTTLVIVCGGVPQNITPHLLDYLINGGQLLCLCSDLLYSVLHSFSTAEVREHELVRFTYGEWKRVKMMHHIFCYQASPAKKQFSRDSSDQSMNGGSTGSSPIAPRTPSMVDIQHNGEKYTIQVQVLGAEETWHTPSLLLATVRGTNGRAIFSQVHLEVDPMQYQDDESKYAALKDSNQARLEILKHILSHHLDIDCTSKNIGQKYGPGYFLGRHDLKMMLLNNESIITDGKKILPELELQFFTKNVEPPEASATKLPVMVLRCPTNFSTVEYFDTLVTERIGRIVIYADVLASTQRLVSSKMCDGLAIITRQQTDGKGRSDNEWLSPEGCAMFSLQLHIPLDSNLGRSLTLVQHLIMVAVVRAIKKESNIENIEVGLKWPNDLYAYGNIKVGGLVASSIVENNIAIVNVGCGINLDNREPTISINDMIKEKSSDLKPITPEKYFAATFNEVEHLIDNVQKDGINYLLKYYYQYWLHSNADITVLTADGQTKSVTIIGVDEYGFLKVQDADGMISSVQSDGNTFDMLRGLIAPKLTS